MFNKNYKNPSKNKIKSDNEYKTMLADHKRFAAEARKQLFDGAVTLDYVAVIALKDKIEMHDIEARHIEKVLRKREQK